MICDDVITLVAETPEAHGIFEPIFETGTQVFCRVDSVARSEYWRARANGLEPRYVFTLSEAADYHGEKVALWNGQRFRILRTYVHGHAIELTVAEATVDAAPTIVTSTATVTTSTSGEEENNGGQT